MALGAFLHNLQHALPHLARLLASVEATPDTILLVVTNDRGGLGVVGTKTLLEGVGVVVGALNQGLTGDVVLHIHLGRVEGTVVATAGGGVDETTGDALDEERVVDLKFYGMLEGLVALLKHGVKALGLGNGTREAVEDEAGHAWVSVTSRD